MEESKSSEKRFMAQLGLTPGCKVRNRGNGNTGEFVSINRSTAMIRFGDRMTVYVPVAMFEEIYDVVKEES